MMSTAFVPTPDEIRASCAEIQSEWDVEQEFNRRVTKPRTAVIPGTEMEPTMEYGEGKRIVGKLRASVGVGKSWCGDYHDVEEYH